MPSKPGNPIDLLSDQTSCHVVYDGGYCPQGLTFQERTELKNGSCPFYGTVDDLAQASF
jgi:urocanate hydratase